MCWLQFNLEAQENYFIYDGTNVQAVRPDRVPLACNHWAVWLGKTDTNPALPSSRWGEIDGKSAKSVMNDLKKGQEFEVKFNRWAGVTCLR
jgi:hypothetical protein